MLQSMKILLIEDDLDAASYLVKAFREAGHEVVGMSAPGNHVQAIEAAGVRHIPLPALTRRPTWRADVRASWQMYRAIRRERPDILHTHNPKPGVLGRIVGRIARVPVIINTLNRPGFDDCSGYWVTASKAIGF